MDVKTIEIRDAGTCIVGIAMRLNPDSEATRTMFARSGFGRTPEQQAGYVVLTKMGKDIRSSYDPYDWGNRTMETAHLHIVSEFDKLQSGSVVDFQFILGETSTPKKSDFL